MFDIRALHLIHAIVLAVLGLAIISLTAFATAEQPSGLGAPAAVQVSIANSSEEITSGAVLGNIGEFDAPVEVITRPGDERTFVLEQGGRLVATDGVTSEVVLDISSVTAADGEQGALGAAFHPSEPFLYVHYTDDNGDSQLVEFAVDAASGIAERSSARNVLSVDQPYTNHNGGEVAFGPDGYLYIGFGDGGLAGDPDRAALDLASPLGKLLRIDPRPGPEGSSFVVPDDNPFVDVPGAYQPIWSLGLRNPWKFSFDELTGDLWIADVGQDRFEEVNWSPQAYGGGRGISYGWSAFEADERFNEDEPADGHQGPLLSYERVDGNCSITGGAVYRGAQLPELYGWYVFGDYCTGMIWAVTVDTSAPGDDVGPSDIIEIGQLEALVAIAVGSDGEMYAVSNAGTVARLAAPSTHTTVT